MNRVELLTSGINGWLLAEEVSSSGTDKQKSRNKYLNEYDKNVAGLLHSPLDPANLLASKTLSHVQRFAPNNEFWEAFEKYPEKDAAAAKMTFAVLMKLSGTRRRLSYIQAIDSQHYLELRAKKAALSPELIEERSKSVLSDEVSIPRLRTLANSIMVSSVRADVEIHNWAIGSANAYEAADSCLAMEQTYCLDFAIGITTFSAGLRGGDLSAAPVLEPRSISDSPGVIYPFVENFWDSYVPSQIPAES